MTNFEELMQEEFIIESKYKQAGYDRTQSCIG